MSNVIGTGTSRLSWGWGRAGIARQPAYQAYQVLHFAFVFLPIVAGLDKFFNLLVPWDGYLAPAVARALPMSPHSWMMIVGVVEIIAGLLVAYWPHIGAYIVTLWLWAIVANLLMIPGFYDIALRDFGLSLGAIALGRMSQRYHPR
jgi:hypothetical protein